MDFEAKHLLEKIQKLTEENNELLHKVRRVQRRQAFWSTLKIIVFIGVTLGAMYWIQPYMETLIRMYNQILGAKAQIDPSILQKIVR